MKYKKPQKIVPFFARFEHFSRFFSFSPILAQKTAKFIFLNPILHRGGHKVPAQLEDLLWLSRGWFKKNDFSWLHPFLSPLINDTKKNKIDQSSDQGKRREARWEARQSWPNNRRLSSGNLQRQEMSHQSLQVIIIMLMRIMVGMKVQTKIEWSSW